MAVKSGTLVRIMTPHNWEEINVRGGNPAEYLRQLNEDTNSILVASGVYPNDEDRKTNRVIFCHTQGRPSRGYWFGEEFVVPVSAGNSEKYMRIYDLEQEFSELAGR